MFWIDTFTSQSTFLRYNFSPGSIPSPHKGYAWAINIVLDQYLHLTENVKKSDCKSTILKLGKNWNQFGNTNFVYIKHVKFQKPTFSSNWDIKR